MANDRIVVVDGVEHHFPADASDDEVSAALNGGTSPQGTHGGLTLAASGEAVPLAAKAATAFANAPNAAKVGGAIARGGTTLAGVVHGAVTGNIPEIIASPIAGWQAGKGGYWLTKHAQEAGAPIGRMLGKLAPYAQAASTLGAAQGVGDLAQIAEPNRKDIGFLGIGGGTHDPNDPALLNAVAAKLRALFGGP